MAYTWARWLPRPGSALLKRRQRPKAQRAPAVSCIRTLRGAGTNIGSVGDLGWKWKMTMRTMGFYPWDEAMQFRILRSSYTKWGYSQWYHQWYFWYYNWIIWIFKLYITTILYTNDLENDGKWIRRLEKITMQHDFQLMGFSHHDFFDDFNGGFTMRIDEEWGLENYEPNSRFWTSNIFGCPLSMLPSSESGVME